MKKLSITILVLALTVAFALPAMAVDEDFIRLADKVVKLNALNESLEADLVDIGNDNLAIGLAGGIFIGAGGGQALAVVIGSLNPVVGLVVLGTWLFEKGE